MLVFLFSLVQQLLRVSKVVQTRALVANLTSDSTLIERFANCLVCVEFRCSFFSPGYLTTTFNFQSNPRPGFWIWSPGLMAQMLLQ